MEEKFEITLLNILKAILCFLNFFNDVMILLQSYEWAVCIYMVKGRYRNLSHILQYMNSIESRFTFVHEERRIRKLYMMVASVFFVILISRYWIPIVMNPVPVFLNAASRIMQIILYCALLITILF